MREEAFKRKPRGLCFYSRQLCLEQIKAYTKERTQKYNTNEFVLGHVV